MCKKKGKSAMFDLGKDGPKQSFLFRKIKAPFYLPFFTTEQDVDGWLVVGVI